MSGAIAISTTLRRAMSSGVFFLQGKAPKEIEAVLTETLACFLPGRTRDLTARLVRATLNAQHKMINDMTSLMAV